LEEKVAELPTREPVADQFWNRKIKINYQNAELSAENPAFEKLKTRRILLFAKV